jgi:fumarylacetoacetase
MIDHTHDPGLESWVESANAPATDFPVQNLPYVCYVRSGGSRPRAGVAIGDQILDLTAAMRVETVAAVMAMPKAERVELRRRISEFLSTKSPRSEAFLLPQSSVELRVPCDIGDYTDFYASIYHARNVGSMFRPDNPLLPNYKWVPVGYHGRASSIVASGARVRRPCGQIADPPAGPPVFAPSRRLDYELEVGAFLGPGNPLGDRIPTAAAGDQLVGVCLLNDWSARDIQAWEYQPLGPFLAKNFATTISPFVVTAEALEPFRCAAGPRPEGDPEPLPHLRGGPPDAYDLRLEVWLRSAKMQAPVRLSASNFRSLYWTLPQMIAHHTSNGCNLRPGDLIGSGTVSGPEKGNRGCLLELTWKGTEPVELPTGEVRRFLEDGDEVILRGWCEAPGFRRIGLGECRGAIAPAID